MHVGAAHVHGHHAPGQILHALSIGELRLCARVELPDLRAERVVLLQLLWRFRAGGARIVAECWEYGVVEHAPLRGRVVGRRNLHGALWCCKVHGFAVGVVPSLVGGSNCESASQGTAMM
jgi:hypothetical protein